MKGWVFLIVLAGSVLLGIVYLMAHEPERGARPRAERALPRLPVEQVAAPLPPRFAGPLPTQVEGFAEALEKGPPLSHVRLRLLEGDQEMGERFLSALRQAAASAQDFDELRATYGRALGLMEARPAREDEDFEVFHDAGLPCDWLRANLGAPGQEHPFVLELFWRKLVRCRGPETEALLAREDAPALWALRHHSLFIHPRFTPALERAVQRILAENQQEHFLEAVRYLSRLEDPTARELHEALWRQAEAEVAEQLEALARFRERMRRMEVEHPLKCPSLPTRPEGIDHLKLTECLEHWAEEDWAATARLATSLSDSPEILDSVQERLTTLRLFTSIEALQAWARERGLLPASASVEENTLSLRVMTKRAGTSFEVRLEEFNFPRHHDDLLVTFAWKLHPELAGVVFEQIPPENRPPLWDQEPSSEVYTLRAYMDGQRFSVTGRNTPSMYDIGAIVGLLNQLLEARGSARRIALLHGDFFNVTVVVGSEAALREADALGLWTLGDGWEMLPRIEARYYKAIRQILGELPL